MPELSIIATHVDAPEWVELLIKSIRKFTFGVDYEIIIIDNCSLPSNLIWLQSQKDLNLIRLQENKGHGIGMDVGNKLASGKYICALDIDSHIQREGWFDDLKEVYHADSMNRLVGCLGPAHKPLHPPLFFYERQFIFDNKISFAHIPNVSTDTAQKAYWDILALGYKVFRLDKGRKIYSCYGDEIWIKGKPTVYHHWYGTRFCENNPKYTKEILDGYPIGRYLENKRKLFDQELVKGILAHGN
jgi:glycosyltransferase involved in cell wall biosynthesis